MDDQLYDELDAACNFISELEVKLELMAAEAAKLRMEVERLKTLLFINQQFVNDDYPDEWLEDWQAYVDQQPPEFMQMIEENLAELPRKFRTARYLAWSSARQKTRGS